MHLVFQNKDVFKYSLSQWFSKCGLWTISLSIPWEQVRNADFSGLTTRGLSQRLWGWDSVVWVLTSPVYDSDVTKLPCLLLQHLLAPTTSRECRL